MCWYRPGLFVTCPSCERPHFHHHRFLWEGEGRSRVGFFPGQVPENEVDGIHPCTCDSPETWYWDLHLPHQEDYERYCHRCVQQARAYRLQHGEDPPEFDRSLEHTPTLPGITWTGHHTRFPRRHEVWSRSRGGPLPDFGADASSDSTEREYHEARGEHTPSNASTEQQWYDAPDYYGLDYVNPNELEGADLREDFTIYYAAATQPYYSDNTHVWDEDADEEYGQWVMSDHPVVDQHAGPEVWQEDEDEDNHYELGDINIPMDQLTTMLRMQLG